MRRAFPGVVVWILTVGNLAAGAITSKCYLAVSPTYNNLKSRAYVESSSGDVSQAFPVHYDHTILNTEAAKSADDITPVSSLIGTAYAAAPNTCYSAKVLAFVRGGSQGDYTQATSPVRCRKQNTDTGDQQFCTVNPETNECIFGGGVIRQPGAENKYSDDCYYDVWYGSQCNSPLILNLGFGSYQLSGTDEPVTFDMEGIGVESRMTWTARAAPMAFLVYDENGNGKIDSGRELFGNNTQLADSTSAANGFHALKAFDSNGDGAIDHRDVKWSRLKLWIDANHDGRSVPAELFSLEAFGITKLGVTYTWSGRRDQYGNAFRYEAELVRNGHAEKYYDVYFVTAR